MALNFPKTRGRRRREAANWLARLQSGREPDVEQRFQRWHAVPANAAAFDRIKSSYHRAGLLRQSPAHLPERLPDAPRPRQLTTRYGMAAAAAVLIVAAGFVLRGNPFAIGGTEAVMLATNIGEIRKVSLADGSRVTLDTSTKVEVAIRGDRRTAVVRYGRARFEVAAAPQPFIIAAGRERVATSAGTIDVERDGPQSRVEVLAGTSKVHVADGKERGLTIGAHQGIASRPDAPVTTLALSSVPDWTRGMMQFEGTPLSDVAALANRYSDQRLVVDGDLGQLRVTGAFRAGDNAALAKALAAAFRLSVRQTPDGNWHLAR